MGVVMEQSYFLNFKPNGFERGMCITGQYLFIIRDDGNGDIIFFFNFAFVNRITFLLVLRKSFKSTSKRKFIKKGNNL